MKVSRRQVLRRRLAGAGAVAVILLAVYLVFLRNSSLFAVDQVEVSGVTASRGADHRSSCPGLRGRDHASHVREDDLRKAVGRAFHRRRPPAPAPTFPTASRSRSRERPPVAVAKIDGEPTPVSADGFVLTGIDFDPKELPSLDADLSEDGRLGGRAGPRLRSSAPPPRSCAPGCGPRPGTSIAVGWWWISTAPPSSALVRATGPRTSGRPRSRCSPTPTSARQGTLTSASQGGPSRAVEGLPGPARGNCCNRSCTRFRSQQGSAGPAEPQHGTHKTPGLQRFSAPLE